MTDLLFKITVLTKRIKLFNSRRPIVQSLLFG